MHENAETMDIVLLVGVDLEQYDLEASLDELEELSGSADMEVVGRITQKRDALDRATCIGAGKLEEIKEFASANEVTLLIFDHELTSTQLRNIEEACGLPVLDRTMLILEIFSQRARSREGRLQVALAQQRYLLPRLAGMGISLSRLGGGGGGAGGGARRGKGETKLELDRRHIRRSITRLEDELESLEIRRENMRSRRKKDGVTTVAIVGYTNVGKSTLLNTLTDAGVLAEDKLFATLDPTARALTLPDGRTVMLIDTVGFVSRLPHHLVEAFKSTLEEAVGADLLLNVCDLSNPEAAAQIEITQKLLAELGVTDTPVITIYNKRDLVPYVAVPESDHTAVISAKEGKGLDGLLAKIAKALNPTQKRMKLLIPFDQGRLLDEIRREGKIFSQTYEAEGTLVDALVDYRILHRVSDFAVE
ncbi:GTPase HflX [Oscillospiraceae bacterium MB08-C2-2]|nr:GTPase HflX [Oscillospiraceae bacterium MB08-C2-2]